jgi:hypothetical protein
MLREYLSFREVVMEPAEEEANKEEILEDSNSKQRASEAQLQQF